MHLLALLPFIASLASAAPLAERWNDYQTHEVIVGSEDGLTLRYDPEVIYAKKGDIVRFKYLAKNHTVTQASFDKPCELLEHGLDSDFAPNPEGKIEHAPIYELVVEDDSKPVWFYCKQTGHCSKGMVGAINPPKKGPKTFEAFKDLAAKFEGESLEKGSPTDGVFVRGLAPVQFPYKKDKHHGDKEDKYDGDKKDRYHGDKKYKYEHHEVIVGSEDGLTLRYDPEVIYAKKGDTVTFRYLAKNHTVTQASFDKPCELLDWGLDSDFAPNPDGDLKTAPSYTLVVEDDSQPIWFFCKQTGHCAMGMVGAINPPKKGPKTFEAFKELASKFNGGPSYKGSPIGGIFARGLAPVKFAEWEKYQNDYWIEDKHYVEYWVDGTWDDEVNKWYDGYSASGYWRKDIFYPGKWGHDGKWVSGYYYKGMWYQL